jgi:hyperosmotically inducible periplasmic protein
MKGKCLGLGLAALLSLAGIGGVSAQGSEADASSVASSGAATSAREARLANRRLAKTVRSRLARLKGVEVLNIIVVAKDGTITLGGSVPNADQIEPVVAATRATPGVEAVNNALRVKAAGQ